MGSTPTRLHLGCGLITPAGWLNVDGSLNAMFARTPGLRRLLGKVGVISKAAAEANWSHDVRRHDVRKPLPWSDASFEAVYASHLLEHLYATEGIALLRECFRVLRPGGVVRMVVPDLKAAVEDYGSRRKYPHLDIPASWKNATPADEFNLRVIFHEPSPIRENFLMRLMRGGNNFHQHKWMYDEESLSQRLKDAGFVEVARRACFESRIEGIREIENSSRVDGGGLAVEGIKPR